MYLVLDNDFNRAHCAGIIGRWYFTPPSYARVQHFTQSSAEVIERGVSVMLAEGRETASVVRNVNSILREVLSEGEFFANEIAKEFRYGAIQSPGILNPECGGMAEVYFL